MIIQKPEVFDDFSCEAAGLYWPISDPNDIPAQFAFAAMLKQAMPDMTAFQSDLYWDAVLLRQKTKEEFEDGILWFVTTSSTHLYTVGSKQMRSIVRALVHDYHLKQVWFLQVEEGKLFMRRVISICGNQMKAEGGK